MVLQRQIMSLRSACRIADQAPQDTDKRVSVVCSYELLHFPMFLQAHLIERLGDLCPSVQTFGFDQMERGLAKTESGSSDGPTILFLDWSDLHPSLSFRSRGEITFPVVDDFRHQSDILVTRLRSWFDSRLPNTTVLVLPSKFWFPFADPLHPACVSPTRIRAQLVMGEIALHASESGAYVIEAEGGVDFRNVANARCPLPKDQMEIIASNCVDLLYRKIRKKVIVVDLDNTLWRGILAEDGILGIECGDEGNGVPYRIFQKYLRKFREEGIYIAFCSKNSITDVTEVLQSDITWIDYEDFSAGICDWAPKSNGLKSIALQLNVGVDSFVFIDDNPAELSEVASTLPDVLCIQTPAQAADWPSFLTDIQSVIWASVVSREDSVRTNQAANRRRAIPQNAVLEHGTYTHLRDLQLNITQRTATFLEPRTIELINKTNQFNFTGKREDIADFASWAKHPQYFCNSYDLSDRFGDFGTVAVAYGSVDPLNRIQLRNLVISCRALGRGLEYLVLDSLAAQTGELRLSATFFPTKRNEPAKLFLETISLPGPLCKMDIEQESDVDVDVAILRKFAASIRAETGANFAERRG